MDPAPTWRGGERQVFLLARLLGERGVDSRVAAAPGSPLAERCAQAGIPVIPLTARGDLDVGAILHLRGALLRQRPDLLHLHTSRAHGVGGMSARLAGVRPVLVTRRVELVPRGPFAWWKYRNLADHYVAISDAVRDSLLRGGVPSDRISRIPSGIELPPAPPDRPVPGSGSPWTVGTLAAFTPQKDPGTWTRSVVRFLQDEPDSRFIWAGDGELRPQVEGAIRDAGIADRVEVRPFEADPEKVWSRLDAFFLPSAFEALGTVLLDAMARGLPIVASRVGGIPEVVRHGQEGLLAEPGDPEAMSAALRRLRREEGLAAELGRAGRTRAREFEIGGIVDRVRTLYGKLLDAAGAAA
ncbi:MAG TPA: glycosyltransferase family 4 protein [bacterium]|nr:glycosyltransferase family 4 protein [bacterium]